MGARPGCHPAGRGQGRACTGGTGIGRAAALRLAADGVAVAVVGRRREPLEEVGVELWDELIALTRCLAVEYAGDGIGCNAVLPASVRTALARADRPDFDAREADSGFTVT